MLSRTVEDSGTVTSALVPWNSCGAYMAGVLGVATGAYLPYAFFNLLSPLISLLFTPTVRIERTTPPPMRKPLTPANRTRFLTVTGLISEDRR